MTDPAEAQFSRLFEFVPRVASAVAIAVGILVLCGWAFDLVPLKSVFSGLVAMKVNTAMGFIFAGISLWNASPHPRHIRGRIASQSCAAAVLLLGLLTVGEYLGGKNFGIDQLVMQDLTDLPGDIPGRMAANTAVNFAALGAALLLLSRKKDGSVLTIHLLAIGAILVAGAALLSYLYDIEAFLRAKLHYTPMALHTAVVFVVLGFGVLSARPEYPFRRIMTSDGAAGNTARRLWPAAIGLQLVMGWVVFQGFHSGYISAAVGLALFAVANMGGLSALFLWNAGWLEQADVRRKQAEDALRKSAETIEDLYNRAPIGYHSLDQDGTFIRINDTELAWLGYRREEVVGKKRFVDLLVPASRQTFRQNFPAFKTRGWVKDLEFDMIRRDGRVLPVLLSATAIKDEHGNFLMSRTSVYDISERRRMEAVLRESERYTRQLLAELPTAVVVHGPDSTIRYGNATAMELLGLTEDQLLGKTAFDPYWHFLLSDGSVLPVELYPVNRVIAENKPLRNYLVGVARAPGAEPLWVYVNAFPNIDSMGALREVVVSFVDITERKRAEEKLLALQAQLREEAIRDPLTGLYNRRYLEETLRRELARAAREGHALSILIGDIDHFKRLNDTFGHQAGDEVLKALGDLLRSHARTSDLPCRYGGEEFVVVLPDMALEPA